MSLGGVSVPPRAGGVSGGVGSEGSASSEFGGLVVRLKSVLRLLAPGFVVVSGIHLVLGARADVALGAHLPLGALMDPTLDSQNRFYGVAFGLYGVLLYHCASDLVRYASVLRCVLWGFFAGGLARLVSLAVHGVPPTPVVALLVLELALPPVLEVWLSTTLRTTK